MADIDNMAPSDLTIDRAASPEPARAGDAGGSSRSALPQFAITAANRQVERVSEVLKGTADAIDDLLASDNLSVPESVEGFAADASDKLRGLAERADRQDAGKLLEGLQRTATSHPLATAGIGAALGAVLGLALTRLGRSGADTRSTRPA